MIVVVVDSVDREVRAGSGAHAALARVAARRGGVRLPPCTLPFGRETIVTVRSPERGGRSADGLPGLSLATEADDAVWPMAVDTDGIGGMGATPPSSSRPMFSRGKGRSASTSLDCWTRMTPARSSRASVTSS